MPSDVSFDDPWSKYRPTEIFFPVELVARPVVSYVKGEDRHQWVGGLATAGPMEHDCEHHHPTADAALDCAEELARDIVARMLVQGQDNTTSERGGK